MAHGTSPWASGIKARQTKNSRMIATHLGTLILLRDVDPEPSGGLMCTSHKPEGRTTRPSKLFASAMH
jgi:hypothetical protein